MSEWLTVRFGDLGQIFDGPHATPTRRDEGPYFLNISSLVSGRLDLSRSDHVSEEDYERWTRRVTPEEGDLLFSYETRLGEAALMPSAVRACLGRRMALLRPRRHIVDPQFLLYCYLSNDFQRTIAERAIHGATVSRIGLATMADWPIRIPDRLTQDAIAGVLGAIDDKVAANERVATSSMRLAATLFLQTLANSDTAATASVGMLADTNAITFSDGYRTKKAEHGCPGLRILRAGDVRDSYLYPAGDDYVSQDYSRQIGLKASRPGDIVLTTKGTVGRVAVVADAVEQVVYSPQVCFFRVKDASRVDPGYLGGWFRSDDLQRQAATLMYKSDMAPYISLRDIRSLAVPLLPIEEQRSCGETQAHLLKAFEASRLEIDRLIRARDELLPLLMSGRVSVKAAESLVEEVV